MIICAFQVPCIPVAQPRQRHRVVQAHGRTFAQNFTPAKHPVQDYKATVRMLAQEHYTGAPIEGPLRLELVFVLPRAKGLIWKTKPMPRLWHCSKPDADNLAKSTKDALNGLLWRDDSQIAALRVNKFIASGDEQPHVAARRGQVAKRISQAPG